jgi:uncharacterized protein YbcC (UPF0753/DUF2309 family)
MNMNMHAHAAEPPRGAEPSDPHAPLRRAIEAAAHLLPAQGPIATFVHHNTLHAFEGAPFHEALADAAALLDCTPYLSPDAFRAHYATGRIDDDDLTFALRQRRPHVHAAARDSAPPLAPGVTHAALERAALLQDLRPTSPQWLRWEREERGLLDAPADRARWDAACDAAARTAPTPHPTYDDAWIDAIGRGVSHRDALLALTGQDPALLANEPIIQLCAAYLDEGAALWVMPGRDQGMLHAWVDLTLHSASAPRPSWRAAIPAEARRIRDQGLSALDVIAGALAALAVQPADQTAYLGRILHQLPGWAGIIYRLETHPTDRLPGAPPTSLTDLLALRLLYDLLALRHVAAQPPLSFPASQPLSGLTEALRQRARALNPTPPPTSHADHDLPWRLFQLARALRLPPDTLRAWSAAQAQAVADALDAFTDLDRAATWQEAYEQHYRRQLLAALAARRAHGLHAPPERPAFQVAFCIDDREEAIRRHLEEAHPEAETFGVAGFFGVACDYIGLDDGAPAALCPVVVTPTHAVIEAPAHPDQAPAVIARASRRRAWVRASRLLHRLNRSLIFGPLLAPIAGFASLLPLLAREIAPRATARLRRALARRLLPTPQTRLQHAHAGDTLHTAHGEPRRLGFTTEEEAARVATTLENMGLTRRFAPLVALMGHGSSSVNNPHMSAYDCGACGGNHGGPNARLFADMANDPAVRAALRARPDPIAIPDDTWFLGAFHNTATDAITLYDLDRVPAPLRPALACLQAALDRARAMSAHERCRRFASAPADPSPARALRHVEGRAEDLSQARPELGHVTNAACVIGRRALTRGLFLDRRAFLVSYDPDTDPDGAILTRVLNAVAPVGAGINLEYYFSCVDNQRLGSGTKLPHNLTALLGVMDGALSDLRTGLPKQMIEIHEPIRLQVVVEATPQTLLHIVQREPALARLIQNGWLQVISLSPSGGHMSFFVPDQGFIPWDDHPPSPTPTAPSSPDYYRKRHDFLAPALVGVGASRGGV